MKAQDPEAVHPEKIIRIDERAVHSHIDELVRGSVEQTLNQLLDAEAERLVNAGGYERTEARKDTRAGVRSGHLLYKSPETSFTEGCLGWKQTRSNNGKRSWIRMPEATGR